jgi:hypothetical protein
MIINGIGVFDGSAISMLGSILTFGYHALFVEDTLVGMNGIQETL